MNELGQRSKDYLLAALRDVRIRRLAVRPGSPERRAANQDAYRYASLARDAGATVAEVAQALSLTRAGVYDLMRAVKEGRR